MFIFEKEIPSTEHKLVLTACCDKVIRAPTTELSWAHPLFRFWFLYYLCSLLFDNLVFVELVPTNISINLKLVLWHSSNLHVHLFFHFVFDNLVSNVWIVSIFFSHVMLSVPEFLANFPFETTFPFARLIFWVLCCFMFLL